MGRKNKGDSLGVVGVVIAAFVAGIAMVPKEIWILGGVCVFAYIGYKIYLALNPVDSVREKAPPPDLDNPMRSSDLPTHVACSRDGMPPESYRIPPKPPELPENAVWIGKNQPVEIGSFKIDAGMLYVGTVLRDLSGSVEPALINPFLAISAPRNDEQGQRLPYWPRYSEIPPPSRGTYLQWLADGRTAPDIEAGYLFLFFYGLERRVLIDIAKDSTLKAELQDILFETRRLLSLYGERSQSVRGYLSKFISLLELIDVQDKSYAAPLPTLLIL